jgi:putative transposase
VGLRLLYLTISQLFGWLRLSRRSESRKTAEVLLLRHQLAVLQRQLDARPKTTLWGAKTLRGLVLAPHR